MSINGNDVSSRGPELGKMHALESFAQHYEAIDRGATLCVFISSMSCVSLALGSGGALGPSLDAVLG